MKTLRNQDLGMLILRVVVGAVFIAHGWTKFSSIAGTAGFFGNIGIPVPLFSAYLVATIEVVGGLAVLLGAFTFIAGLLLAIVMLVAIFAAKGVDTFMGPTGYELELVLLAAVLAIAKINPGKYSITRAMKKDTQMP